MLGKSEDPEESANLRYMHILSVSSQMNASAYSKEEAIKIVKDYEGARLSMPGRPIIIKGDCDLGCLNIEEDQENTLFVASTNESGTVIFGFERYTFDNGIPAEYLERQEGKTGIVSGILKKITVEGNFLPRFRIHVIEAKMIVE